eukprot:GFUD01037478.1.p1 GENE.GFUD01037478.1~~GFUD01037478.1.p1  ORF type:complete len:1402 (+),score=479.73 GFUD01037478.1:84-4289(+)
MLYIFRVDTGCMITLEMNLALETVAHLKKAVETTWSIPEEKQVLLISGGESLEPDERVCKYTAGSSDTNPIFLFSMASIESNTPPASSLESHTERDLQPEVEASLSLPDTHNTVAVRTTLAQEYVKVSREQARVCESQIHDQHLQHQGWAAALANLEDSVVALEKRHSKFKDTYAAYLDKREHYREVIDTFDDDLHVLSKIPVLPALLDEEDSGHGSNGVSTDGSRPPSSMLGGGKNKTLLDWINQAGNNSLEQVADSCYRSLEQLDQMLIQSVEHKIVSCVEGANNNQMKEIRGLGDRLSGLEQLLLDAKRKVTEQQDLAAAFVQNQARASGLRDTSILPDLCASHRQQLLVMMRNHQHILSIRKRCAKAKEELSVNLYTRLKWVMFIQRQMAENGQQLVLYHEELRRLSRRLEVMEQLHLAPSIYLATVVEVVRRRSFSQHYLKKAEIIAGTFGEVHSEEVRTRQIFQEKLNKHFLSTMFQGMDDIPPDFATVPPQEFDNILPQISLQDLERLRTEFPNIAESLSMPDRNTLSSLLTRSFNQALTAEEGTALHNLQTMTNKIPLSGSGLGSVSVINRICGESSAGSRKKSRLDALAASRDRRGPTTDTDSDEEPGGSNGKARHNIRKMSRSLTVKNGSKERKIANIDQDNQEFVTANFYDEVEKITTSTNKVNISSSSADPSSSSAANTNSSAAPSSDGSLLKNQWPSQTELQSQIEDKTKEIEKLRANLGTAEAKLEHVETRIASIVGVSKTGLDSLRDELQGMKSKVDTDRQDVLGLLAEMTKKMMDGLQELETLSILPTDLQREKTLRKESESELEDVKAKLETEVHKLDDCHREIDIYRYQLEEANRALDSSKMDMEEEKQKFQNEFCKMKEELEKEIQELKSKFKKEKRELKQAMELEHELELDNYKEKVMKGEGEKVESLIEEISVMKKQLDEKELELNDLKRKTELMEVTHSGQEENQKKVETLEADFQERQKTELSQLEEKLREHHRKELEALKESKNEEMLTRMEEMRQKMVDSSQLSVGRLKTKLETVQNQKILQKEEEMKARFNLELTKLEDVKLMEIEEAKEKVKKKSRMEMETLRSRFKIMQTTGTLERSPSVSESEFSIESPRLGSMEHLGNMEHKLEEMLLMERTRWEQERDKLCQKMKELQMENEEYQEQIKDVRNTERLRNSAEKQVVFNEAIRKVVEEKDKKIEGLEISLTQKAQRDNQSMLNTLEEQLAEVQRKNAQLDSELREANQKLKMNMMCSIATMEPAESLKQLQEENMMLKQQLSRSMTSLISTGKVSVTSADKGDIVLVVWSDEHNNYQVYHEGTVLHFLHTESISTLGLVEAGGLRKKHITSEVVEKEYCQAKKAENRFRVRQGTKFYRVKCKLVEKTVDNLARSLLQAQQM